MSVTHPIMDAGLYYGNITLQQGDQILQIQKAESIPNYENTIFLFPDELIDAAEKENISVRQYIKNNGIDVKQYIGKLRPYQTVGTAFLYASPRSIISDGVGLGKTVEVSALLNILKVYNQLKGFVAAVEKSALAQTTKDITSKTGLRIIRIPPEKNKLTKTLETTDWSNVDGIVITHNTLVSNEFNMWLASHITTNERGIKECDLFDTFLLDESSVVKNKDTAINKACSNFISAMRRVHLMNATMYELTIKDIYNQIDLINPVVLPKYYRIEQEYCIYKFEKFYAKGGIEKTRRVFVGYKNTDKFKNSLKLFIFGRYIEDTKNNYEVHYVQPTTDQLLAINSGLRYQEVLNCPTLLEEQAKKQGKELRYDIPFDADHVPKLKKLKALLEKYHDKKIMIYIFHKEAQQYIKNICDELNMPTLILNGKVISPKKRQEIMDAFNTGECQVVITSVKRALNFYDGDVCIFYSIESNPAKLEQIRGRIERNVDDKVKTYILLIYEHTGEEALFEEKLVIRGNDSKKISTDAKTAVDYFIEGKHFRD